MSRNHSDFTLEAYAALLEKAAARYTFVQYGKEATGDGKALWRHDIDFSPHRALAMAEIEGNYGLCVTYFVQVTSPFYNVFEPAITKILQRISELGHRIGLHFEAGDNSTKDQLSFEAKTLSEILGVYVEVFSLHNPTIYKSACFEEKTVAGLVNGSASVGRDNFIYCSDSNGLWRFRTLADILDDPGSHNVHVLTHPEWWNENPILPRERVRLCIEGRANYCNYYYDQLLAQHKRPNIGSDGPEGVDHWNRLTK